MSFQNIIRPFSFFLSSSFFSAGELVWESSFDGSDGFVDAPLNGQDGWIGSDAWLVDSSAAVVALSEPFHHLTKAESVRLGTWDRAIMVVTVQVDLSKDVNQTPLRFGFTSSMDDNDLPIPLPFGNSNYEATALAAELFHSGYPFLQTEGVTHHSGSLTFSPFFAANEGVVSLSGAEVDIYPHARLQLLTLVNGDENTAQNEIQFVAQVPLANGPAFGEGDVFKLIYEGEETLDLLVTSTDADIQSALENLPSIGSGNVTVTGNFADGFEVGFTGSLAHQNLSQLEVIEPMVQDHLTQTLELTYDLLKTTALKTFRTQVTVRNLDTGQTYAAPAEEFVDNFAHGDVFFYPSLRGGNFAEGGGLVVSQVSLFRESADDDSDGDGFSNRVELQFDTDYLDPASTPLATQVLVTDFTSTLDAPLDDSPDWFANDLWLTQAEGNATLDIGFGVGPRAITESSISVEPEEVLFLSTEFRLTDQVNFAVLESALFNVGFTELVDPDANSFRIKAALHSSPAGNGTLFLDGLELGAAKDFFETASYDADTDESVIAGASRATGPSDWMRLDLVVVKGVTEGTWVVKKQFSDLEGDHQGSWEQELEVTNLSLWNEDLVRGGFGATNGQVTEVLGGLEVRKFDFKLVETGDFDGDLLLNFEEFLNGSDPQVQDSDGDQQGDWFEVNGGSDPTDPNSIVTDIPLVTTSYRIEEWGELEFVITGPPGMELVIEYSEDLQNWSALTSLPQRIDIFGDAQLYEFTDLFEISERYFRVTEYSD